MVSEIEGNFRSAGDHEGLVIAIASLQNTKGVATFGANLLAAAFVLAGLVGYSLEEQKPMQKVADAPVSISSILEGLKAYGALPAVSGDVAVVLAAMMSSITGRANLSLFVNGSLVG